LILTNDNTRGTTAASKNISLVVTSDVAATGFTSGSDITAFQYTFVNAGATPIGETTATGAIRQFTSTEDLRAQMQHDARLVGDDHTVANDGVFTSAITVEINSKGQFEIKNPGSAGADEYDLRIAVTGLTSAGVTENTRFTQNFQTLSGTLTTGSSISRLSQSFNAATHSASIDVFDSLGTKHTLRLDFRKTALNSSGGTEWIYEVSVPSPGDIGGTINKNELTNLDAGRISFTNTGALALATIPSLTYTANNGSAPNQTIDLNFGTINSFDGMTSFDNPSGTSGISQDGFPGGDLVGIRIDQSGTLVGSFSNGRSFGLAQIGMAKFSNNEGLVSDGGNVYLQSANSGDPIIGTAATAGRGFMQSSALEASNVDLSKSLTQLIIIQRGYQANGKTITTSDTLLETLIGLKR
jgi:flagellar hook protein FlgE